MVEDGGCKRFLRVLDPYGHPSRDAPRVHLSGDVRKSWAVTEGGRYLRYSFRPVGIHTVSDLKRRIEGNPVELVPMPIIYRTAKTICYFQTVEQHRLARLQANPHVEQIFNDDEDSELTVMAHRYNYGTRNLVIPCPSSFQSVMGVGAVLQGDQTYVNGRRVAREALRRVQEIEPAIHDIDETKEVIQPVAEVRPPTMMRDEDHVQATKSTESRFLKTGGGLCQGLGQDTVGSDADVLGVVYSLDHKNSTSVAVDVFPERLAEVHRVYDRLVDSSTENGAREPSTTREDFLREVADYVAGTWIH